MKVTATYVLLGLSILLTSCTGLKYVPKGETLYTGAKLSVISGNKVKDQKKAMSEAKAIIVPKPNFKFLGSRPFLWIYGITNNNKDKGVKHWIREKVGEPPVLMSLIDPILVSNAIDAKLYNMGFFTSYCTSEMVESKDNKATSLLYKLVLFEPYLYREIYFPGESDTLNKHVSMTQLNSLLKKGDRYDLEVLMKERIRIDEQLKEEGFYYFNRDQLVFKLDTSLRNNQIRLHIGIKEDIPAKSRLVYRIADVHVYPDYKVGKDSVGPKAEYIDSVFYYNETGYIRPESVLRAVFLKNNHIYNRKEHNLTLNHLNGIGVFKFVNVRITDKDSSSGNWISTKIMLIPLPQKSLSVELQGVSKSNNFIGPSLSFSQRNRNAFKGAELLIYNLRTSVETQFNGIYKGQYTYEINPRIELYVPRFMLPFNLKLHNNYVPRTKYILEYSYLSRVGYFDMNAFKFTYGYKWKQHVAIDHDLSLVSINYYNIYNTSLLFDNLISGNILLKRRFEEQFIAGIAYSFFYNEQLLKLKANQFYFNTNLELAGNSLSLYKKIVSGSTVDADNPSSVFGIKFAQFVRLDIDIRDYIHLSEKTMLVTRVIGGWGLPYGNSNSMPFIKQFFSGGAYSVRGFRAYSIGPGSYAPPDTLKNILILQQGGEIKLEGNIEYRFPIFSVFKGALFADFGNVWINNKQPELPGAEFNSSRFVNEFAVGLGTGIRMDLNFFVLRLDMGIPARKPGLPEGQRWVLAQTNFSKIIFNIAFGYPF